MAALRKILLAKGGGGGVKPFTYPVRVEADTVGSIAEVFFGSEADVVGKIGMVFFSSEADR